MPRLDTSWIDEPGGGLYLAVDNTKMTHARLQALVVEECQKLGLHVHTCKMLTSQAGFPDLVIISVNGVYWRELKVPPDELTSAQKGLMYTLRASGQDYAIWTPEDWESGQIKGELRYLAKSWAQRRS